MKHFILFLAVLSAFSAKALKVTRTVFPSEIQIGQDVIVTIDVKKEGAEGFAKLIEEIPAGFDAVEMNSATGNFVYEDGQLRIIWLVMPDGDGFKVEYKLKHTGSEVLNTSMKGVFHYILNETRAKIDLLPTALKVTKSAAQKAADKKDEQKTEVNVQQPKSIEPTAKVDTAVKAIVEEKIDITPVKEVPSNETAVENEVKEVVKEEVAPVVEAKAAVSEIVYKVQLGAYSSEKPKSIFGDLPEVHFDKVNGVYKYYSGKFTNEADARAIIQKAKSSGFEGAFLVKFKDGKRI